MCGICGFFYKEQERPLSSQILNSMVDKMLLRGPDGRGVFKAKGGALGHRRLTIIDLVGGQQPMLLPLKQAALVVNGEIYNYPELSNSYLLDETLLSTSDTEVLLHILNQKGVEALPLLNGMFAFAYWDILNQKVILGRDAVGQKPLFYYFGNNSFIFASELSSLAIHPDVPKDIDTDTLAYYLLFEGYPHPHTPLKGVKKLAPGHYMILDLCTWTLKIERYWNCIPESSEKYENDERLCLETFEDIFSHSIKRHLRADVEIGIYLSGGLDSPSLVKGATSVLGNQAVKTFTIKHELTSFDESVYAKEVADYFGTIHYERVLRKEDFLKDIDFLLKEVDEPIADPGFLAIYQVAKFSREHVKVILSGNGGDEFFAGYAPFQAAHAYSIAHKLLPDFLTRLLIQVAKLPKASHNYMNLPFKIQKFLRGVSSVPAEVLMQWIGAFNHNELQSILNKDHLNTPLIQPDHQGNLMLYKCLNDEYERLPKSDIVTILLHTFQQFYLPVCICNHSDKASMKVSQELRSPFLDMELMKFANHLPSNMKYRNGKTKYILRKYHQNKSPNGISNRPKQGFTIPIALLLTTSLKKWANDILDPNQLKKEGLFSAEEVRKLWQEHQTRTANNAKQLWTIIAFQQWLNSAQAEWKSSYSYIQ